MASVVGNSQTHNPTHKMRCLARLPRTLAVPAVFVSRCKTYPGKTVEADGNLGTVGTVKLTWVGTPTPLETRVTRADAPQVLEYNDMRWELEAFGGGTRLTLWNNIDRRFISWGATGWHICFDLLERRLAGEPIGRIVGAEAMKFGGWQRLNAEYAKQFGVETPSWPPQAAQKS